MKYLNSVKELIGNTLIVKLNNLNIKHDVVNKTSVCFKRTITVNRLDF